MIQLAVNDEQSRCKPAQMMKRPIPKGSFNAERAALAAHVAAEAQRLYPKQIRFRFETCIQVRCSLGNGP